MNQQAEMLSSTKLFSRNYHRRIASTLGQTGCKLMFANCQNKKSLLKNRMITYIPRQNQTTKMVAMRSTTSSVTNVRVSPTCPRITDLKTEEAEATGGTPGQSLSLPCNLVITVKSHPTLMQRPKCLGKERCTPICTWILALM